MHQQTPTLRNMDQMHCHEGPNPKTNIGAKQKCIGFDKKLVGGSELTTKSSKVVPPLLRMLDRPARHDK